MGLGLFRLGGGVRGVLVAAGIVVAALMAQLPPPATAQTRDSLLWLEDSANPRTLNWIARRNAESLTRLYADPRYPLLLRDALSVLNDPARIPIGPARDGFIYNFWRDPTHVRGLWRRSPMAAYAAGAPEWETLLDLDALAERDQRNWVWKGEVCQPFGARCIIALSDGGKDAVTRFEFDLERKEFLADGFALAEAKSEVAWLDDDTLAVATHWEPGALTTSGYPFIVKLWRRGEALSAAREIARGAQGDVGVQLARLTDSDGSGFVLMERNTTFFEAERFRIAADGATPLPLPARAEIVGLHKAQLVALINQDWGAIPAGALASISVDDLTAPARLVHAPGPREAVLEARTTEAAVLVAGLREVQGRLLRLAFDGQAWVESEIATPPGATIAIAGADPTEPTAFVTAEGFLSPPSVWAVDVRRGRAREAMATPAQFAAQGLSVAQFTAKSRDGTMVPYFVVGRADRPAGPTPTLMRAYGGFQIAQTPQYSPALGKLWLEGGGVFVLANIRGGGEFGPKWHQAGLKTNRQVIYDDFYAVAEDLFARGITAPQRLGITGRSNGGLLMGVALTQRPELFSAAVMGAPLLDMQRYDQLPPGASWVAEYGAPADPVEGAFLERISPYAQLRRNRDMPEPLILTSTKDDRVHPGHARKFAEKMDRLGMDALYFENTDGGHSVSANLREAARQLALEYVYLSQKLKD